MVEKCRQWKNSGKNGDGRKNSEKIYIEKLQRKNRDIGKKKHTGSEKVQRQWEKCKDSEKCRSWKKQ